MGKIALIPQALNNILKIVFTKMFQNLDNYVTAPGKDFTRDRKITIFNLVSTILNFGGSCIREELRQNPNTNLLKIVDSSRKHGTKLEEKIEKLKQQREKRKQRQKQKGKGKEKEKSREEIKAERKAKKAKKAKEKRERRIGATPSAFVQQRLKLLPSFFEDAFMEFVSLTQSCSYTYRKLRILAVDGSDVYILANPKEKDYYIKKKDDSSPYNLIHLDALYDILTGVYVAASTRGKRKADEKRVAIELMIKCEIENVLLTADRGYESYNFIAHIIERGWKFLIRGKDVLSNGIAAGLILPDTEEFDVDIDLLLTNKSTNDAKQLEKDNPNGFKCINGKKFDFLPNTSRKKDPMCTYRIKFRIARVKLEPGKYEILITNLDREEYPLSELKHLYHMRWGIETSYRNLKYSANMRYFHTKLSFCAKQEIFAHLIMYNYTQFIINYVEETTEKSSTNKYKLKKSFVAAVGTVRRYLNGQYSIDEMLEYIDKDTNPVRPGRKSKRRMKPRKPASFNYRVTGC